MVYIKIWKLWLTTDLDYRLDNFLLTTVGVSGESAPFTVKNLRFTTTEEWKDYFRVAQNRDDADTQNYGVPDRVIKSPDLRKFGLSPIPDKVYRIFFYAYNLPTELSAHSDQLVFPNTYNCNINELIYVINLKILKQQLLH